MWQQEHIKFWTCSKWVWSCDSKTSKQARVTQKYTEYYLQKNFGLWNASHSGWNKTSLFPNKAQLNLKLQLFHGSISNAKGCYFSWWKELVIIKHISYNIWASLLCFAPVCFAELHKWYKCNRTLCQITAVTLLMTTHILFCSIALTATYSLKQPPSSHKNKDGAPQRALPSGIDRGRWTSSYTASSQLLSLTLRRKICAYTCKQADRHTHTFVFYPISVCTFTSKCSKC